MKYIILILVILAFFFTVKIARAEAPERTLKDYTPKELITHYSRLYGVSEPEMLRVIKCESSLNPNAVNWQDSHRLSEGSHGIAQFSKDTIAHFGKDIGLENPDPYNPKEAIEVMAYMWSIGKQKHWSCY